MEHTAARVRMMCQRASNPLVTFRRVNTEGSVYADVLVGQWLCEIPRVPRVTWLNALLFAAFAACLAGTGGDVIEGSFTGARRYLQPFICLALVMISAHLFVGEQRWLRLVARWLGSSNYDIYLLHTAGVLAADEKTYRFHQGQPLPVPAHRACSQRGAGVAVETLAGTAAARFRKAPLRIAGLCRHVGRVSGHTPALNRKKAHVPHLHHRRSRRQP